MRKLITFLLGIILIVAPSIVLAASSATQQHTRFGSLHRLDIAWTAHTDGSFTSFVTRTINGMLYGVETNPGDGGITDNYDITLTDDNGLDVMGGALANRDTLNTEFIQPYNAVQGSYLSMPVHGALTMALSGNSAASVTGEVTLFYFAE